MSNKNGAALLLLTLSVASSAWASPAPEPVRTSVAGETSGNDQRAANTVRAQARAVGSRAEEARYSAREAASKDAKNYRAGDVVVISTTALAIVLLVILIIILI